MNNNICQIGRLLKLLKNLKKNIYFSYKKHDKHNISRFLFQKLCIFKALKVCEIVQNSSKKYDSFETLKFWCKNY